MQNGPKKTKVPMDKVIYFRSIDSDKENPNGSREMDSGFIVCQENSGFSFFRQSERQWDNGYVYGDFTEFYVRREDALERAVDEYKARLVALRIGKGK